MTEFAGEAYDPKNTTATVQVILRRGLADAVNPPELARGVANLKGDGIPALTMTGHAFRFDLAGNTVSSGEFLTVVAYDAKNEFWHSRTERANP